MKLDIKVQSTSDKGTRLPEMVNSYTVLYKSQTGSHEKAPQQNPTQQGPCMENKPHPILKERFQLQKTSSTVYGRTTSGVKVIHGGKWKAENRT